jgi:hypothetical protein
MEHLVREVVGEGREVDLLQVDRVILSQLARDGTELIIVVGHWEGVFASIRSGLDHLALVETACGRLAGGRSDICHFEMHCGLLEHHLGEQVVT